MRVSITWDDDRRPGRRGVRRLPNSDIAIPASFCARAEEAGRPAVELDIVVTDDGALLCDAIHVYRVPDGPSLDSHSLRAVPVARLLDRAYSAAPGMQLTVTPNATITEGPVNDALKPPRQRRSKRTITNAFLRDVARVWRDTEGESRTARVAEVYETSERSAARWMQLARKRGLVEDGH